MLRSWWALWRRRRAPDLSEGAELREIAAGRAAPQSAALSEWLASHERPGGPLTPGGAAQWLEVWREERAAG
eukprot:8477631-Alexandrium_andersonii.AAC.1